MKKEYLEGGGYPSLEVLRLSAMTCTLYDLIFDSAHDEDASPKLVDLLSLARRMNYEINGFLVDSMEGIE